VGGPFAGSAHRLSEHWENPIMNKAELIEAATALGIQVPSSAPKHEIEKLIDAALTDEIVPAPADPAPADETADDDEVEAEGDVSPGPDEVAIAEPAAAALVTYGDEVASLVAVVTADCATPFGNTFLTLKPGQEVEGLLASQLVDAGLAEPKD
jgi:hypothetical protein